MSEQERTFNQDLGKPKPYHRKQVCKYTYALIYFSCFSQEFTISLEASRQSNIQYSGGKNTKWTTISGPDEIAECYFPNPLARLIRRNHVLSMRRGEL